MFTLFLPGSFRRSSDYVWLSNCLAQNSDFYTVDYPVSTTVAKLNSEIYSSDCMLQVRRELIYGSQSISDSRLSIAYEDSVMGSFLEQVKKRHGNSISDHEILSHTLVVGHSQGAGHAAVMAIDHILNGVLLISGPADSYLHVPSSWTEIRARTSRTHVRMFIHAEDRHSRMCLYHSTLLGLNNISVLTESSRLEDVISSQVVIDTRPLPPLKSHDCLTFDSEKLDDFNRLYLSTVIATHKSLLVTY
jgi:pimeloyl-ACP methyl ester carboxylesterase